MAKYLYHARRGEEEEGAKPHKINSILWWVNTLIAKFMNIYYKHNIYDRLHKKIFPFRGNWADLSSTSSRSIFSVFYLHDYKNWIWTSEKIGTSFMRKINLCKQIIALNPSLVDFENEIIFRSKISLCFNKKIWKSFN